MEAFNVIGGEFQMLDDLCRYLRVCSLDLVLGDLQVGGGDIFPVLGVVVESDDVAALADVLADRAHLLVDVAKLLHRARHDRLMALVADLAESFDPDDAHLSASLFLAAANINGSGGVAERDNSPKSHEEPAALQPNGACGAASLPAIIWNRLSGPRVLLIIPASITRW